MIIDAFNLDALSGRTWPVRFLALAFLKLQLQLKQAKMQHQEGAAVPVRPALFPASTWENSWFQIRAALSCIKHTRPHKHNVTLFIDPFHCQSLFQVMLISRSKLYMNMWFDQSRNLVAKTPWAISRFLVWTWFCSKLCKSCSRKTKSGFRSFQMFLQPSLPNSSHHVLLKGTEVAPNGSRIPLEAFNA